MPMSPEEVWGRCSSFIRDNVDVQPYKTWFEPIKAKKVVGASLSIEVPSKFFYEWLEEHYVDLLKVAIEKELGKDAKLIYLIRMENSYENKISFTQTIPSSGRSSRKTENRSVPKAIGGLKNPFVIPEINNIKIESQLNPNQNFDEFVKCKCNRVARSVAQAVSNKPGGTSFNPLFIFGNGGLGKTHLAHAIGVNIKEKYPEKAVLYVPIDRFIQQFTSATINNTRNDFVHFYQFIDVLIVDDVQFVSGKQKTQDVFFHIFNHLHQNGRQVVMTSDKPPVGMQDIENRLLSRFKWGLSTELKMPDEEDRFKILKHKIFQDGTEVSDEVINYMAEHIKSNIRELEGIKNTLIAQSIFDKTSITVDLVKAISKNYLKSTKKEISIEYIQRVVSDHFRLDVDVLHSKTRKRDVVQARQAAMYFSKKYTGASLAHIGSMIGRRNHATVLHACKTVEDLISTDKNFCKHILDMEYRIKH